MPITKKLAHLPVIAVTILLAACSTSRSGSSTISKEDVRGSWTLNNITYDGLSSSDNVKLTLLDEGSPACLTGSTWVLPGNGYGSYTINRTGSGCISGQKNIIWSHRTENGKPVFQYKRLESGVKAKEVADGYKFTIISAGNDGLQLQSELSFEGRPLLINYQFTKTP